METTPALLNDGIQSMVAQLGTDRDKASSVEYVAIEYADQQLETVYRTSWLARKIVTIPALDTFRAWRAWQAEKSMIELLEKEEARLKLRRKLVRAKALARLYGEAFIYFDIGERGQGVAATPLNVDKVKKNGIRFVTVLSHRQLVPGDVDQDPLSETFGEPIFYRIAGGVNGDVTIHPSRLMRFVGAERPDEFAQYGNVRRSDSVLFALLATVAHFDSTEANVASLVFEAKIDVISVKGLMAIAGNPYEEAKLLARYRLAATAKGNNGMLLLDGDTEEYSQKTLSFQSLTDIMDRQAQNASGGADIPMTRLFGQSPGGMNATGDSDIRNYYDRIAAEQELETRPIMESFDECLIRSALGSRPPEVHYKWSSLWQMSDKERSELGTAGANMVKTIKDTGLIPDEVLAQVVVNLATQDGTMPGLEGEYATFFEEGGEWDLEQQDPPDETPPGGKPPVDAQNVADEQLRAPKGSPIGGQWIKSGEGSGGAVEKALASVASTKYPASAVKALTHKDPKTLSHYEKKVLAKYKTALANEKVYEADKQAMAAKAAAAEVKPDKVAPTVSDLNAKYKSLATLKQEAEVAQEAYLTAAPGSDAEKAAKANFDTKKKAYQKAEVDSEFETLFGTFDPPPVVPAAAGSASTDAALNKVATAQYPAEKVKGLMSKDPKTLTHYEKKKLAAYKKALQEEQASSKPAAAKPAAGKKVDPNSAEAKAVFAQIGAQHYGMKADTVAKLATGEWQPQGDKKYQKDAQDKAKAYLETGVKPAAPTSIKTSGGTYGPTLKDALDNDPPPVSNKALVQTALVELGPLAPHEIAAAKKYTGSTYHDINHALRGGSTHHLVPAIDAAVAKSKAKEDMVVVRGVSSNGMAAWLANSGGEIKIGSTITDAGYASTTRSTQTATKFAGGGSGYGLKIKVPKGARILPLKSISNYAHEDEFLLPHGSSFKITGFDQKSKVITVDLVSG